MPALLEIVNSSQPISLLDKRRQPRYNVCIKACMTTANGEVINVTITNLSYSGLQLKAAADLPEKLFPHFTNPLQSKRVAPVIFNLTFVVSTTEKAHAQINIDCQSVYIRRTTNNQLLLGCEFNHFKQHCDHHLADHIVHFCA